jgi:hypothetical protein
MLEGGGFVKTKVMVRKERVRVVTNSIVTEDNLLFLVFLILVRSW